MEVYEAVNIMGYPWMVSIKNVHEVITGFQRIVFPNYAGAIDSIHVPIICLPEAANDCQP